MLVFPDCLISKVTCFDHFKCLKVSHILDLLHLSYRRLFLNINRFILVVDQRGLYLCS